MTSTNALDFLSDPCHASVRIPSSNQGNSGKGTKQLYADWQSLSYGNGEAFRGKMIASDGLAEMRLIHLPALDTTKKQALANQIALIQSVGSSLSKKIIEYSLDETSSRIVLSYTESQELKEFLACTTPFSRLELGANLLAKINGSLKVGLYHGCISNSSVRVVTESSSRCSLDYLERFYSQTMIEDYGPGILYDKDVSDSVKLINEILYPLTEEKTAVDLLSSRQLAILKRLCRDSVDGTPAESVFEHWLDFFRDWTEATEDGGAPLPLPIAKDESITREVTCNHATEAKRISSVCSDRTCENPMIHRQPTVPTDIDQPDHGIDQIAIESNSVRSPFQKPLKIGETLGQYRLDAVIGKGGMGIVYRGTNIRNGQQVAVKVLQFNGSDIAHAIRRFTKEARILANVQNEFVTRLFDVGEEKGYHFLAMEFIDGTNLKQWMRDKLPLDERESLTIVGNIARALITAHAQQIIHRDIKPENILLSIIEAVDKANSAVELPIDQLCIKLTDFGIARHIKQSTSMEVTRAGAMLGTPLYMSPEQCKGNNEVGTSTDVYSLGITLYELLCGQPPFNSDDPMKLAAMQCFDRPPDIQKRNLQITDRTAALVAKMLAKKPSDRFSDANQLVHEIDRILSGTPSDFEAHPRLPDLGSNKIWERVFEWNLQSSPAELWPHVTNTDRLNRAAGLPSVEFRNEKDPQKGLRRFGSFRIGGVKVEWEEHPFEWIEGTRMGVLREFSSGPFKWFMSTVELRALPAGGTKLIHTVKIEPRNPLGRLISTIEAGWKGGRALNRIYKRIDRFLIAKDTATPLWDVYQEEQKLRTSKSKRIEQRMDAMLSKGVAIETSQKLCDFIKAASPQSLAKIRTHSLAERLKVPSDEMLDACLVAASCGLLKLEWDILCPTCRAPASSESLLSNIGRHSQCEACDVEFQSNIGNAIELVFRVHPELREADVAQYCVGGPGHSPHVVSQLRLMPGERIELQISASIGDYLIRGRGLPNQQHLRIRSTAAPSDLTLKLSTLGKSKPVPTLRMGQISLTLANDLESTQVVRIERTIDRSGIVTAAAASTHARFRELFPEQAFRSDVPVATDELSLFACDVNNVEHLYATLGDNEAYHRIQMLQVEIQVAVNEYHGAVVKSIGEGLLASFQECANAVQAAIAIHERIAQCPVLSCIELGIGIHSGRTLISTQNGRLDYFGSTARTVANMAKRAGKDIVLTETVFTDAITQQTIKTHKVTSAIVPLDVPGLTHQVAQRISIKN